MEGVCESRYWFLGIQVKGYCNAAFSFSGLKFYIQENYRYLHSFCLIIMNPEVWQRNLKILKK